MEGQRKDGRMVSKKMLQTYSDVNTNVGVEIVRMAADALPPSGKGVGCSRLPSRD